MKSKLKTIFSAIAAIALIASGIAPAEAKMGGSSSSSSSRSSSSSSHSSSSSRMGGGQSVGMSRPSVVQSVRSQPAPAAPVAAPTPPRPAPAYSQSAPAAAPAPARQGMPGWVAPAAGGAAAGYLLGRVTAPSPAVNNNYGNNGGPGYQGGNGNQNGSNGYQDGNGIANNNTSAGYAQSSHQTSGSGFGSFLILCLLGAGGYFAWRAYKNGAFGRKDEAYAYANDSKSSTAASYASGTGSGIGSGISEVADARIEAPLSTIEQAYVDRFKELQKHNNAGDKVALRKMLTTEMYETLEPTMGASNTQVLSMRAKVVDTSEEATQKIASVHYTGTISEDAGSLETLDEVWHFTQQNGSTDWRLAGIEQV